MRRRSASTSGPGSHERPEAHASRSVVEGGEQHRHARAARDVQEARLEVARPACACPRARSPGRVAAPRANARTDASTSAVGARAVHRNAAHPAQHGVEGRAEERVLADERDAQVEREHRGDAHHEVPVRRMRGHGDHELGQVGERRPRRASAAARAWRARTPARARAAPARHRGPEHRQRALTRRAWPSPSGRRCRRTG